MDLRQLESFIYIEDSRGSPSGRVTIGFPYAVGRALSCPFVKAFRSRYPKANLCITEGLTIHLYEWLLSGRVDIALLHDPVPSTSLDILPIREDDLLLLGYRKRTQPAIAPRMHSVLALATSAERPLTTLMQRAAELLQESLLGLPHEDS